jgi:hypothetical protein
LGASSVGLPGFLVPPPRLPLPLPLDAISGESL